MSEKEKKKDKVKREELRAISSAQAEFKKAQIRSRVAQTIKEARIRSAEAEKKKTQAQRQSEE